MKRGTFMAGVAAAAIVPLPKPEDPLEFREIWLHDEPRAFALFQVVDPIDGSVLASARTFASAKLTAYKLAMAFKTVAIKPPAGDPYEGWTIRVSCLSLADVSA